MISFTEAYDKLSRFGSADEIAEFLKEQGIVAYRNRVYLCALSEFLSKETCLVVRTDGATIRAEAYGISVREEILTKAMKDFVVRFDKGDYPEITKETLVEAGPSRS